MKLYLLADNRQEKGKQLEFLIKRILLKNNCTNIQPNVKGADEIDVMAEHTTSIKDCHRVRKIICECKAHDIPINMNDWDKFLGKFFKNDNGDTLGFMIALSGANGNVLNDINAYKAKYNNRIKLISGQDLIAPLSLLYQIHDEDHVNAVANDLAGDLTIETNLVLYNDDIYWLLLFSSGTFTIFDKNLNSIDNKKANKLINLISEETVYVASQYRNVRQEYDSKRKKQFVKTISTWKLMEGRCSILELQNTLKGLYSNNNNFEIPYIEECLTEIPYINLSNSEVSLKEPKDIDYVLFYKTAISDFLPISLFSNYYLEHIDNHLLERICTIQFGIKLTEQEMNDCLFILKHSPSALLYSLHSDKLLKNVQLPFVELNNKFVNIFKNNLLSYFKIDCEADNSCFMFSKLGIRDINISTSLNAVTVDGKSKSITTNKKQCYINTENSEMGIRFIAMDG